MKHRFIGYIPVQTLHATSLPLRIAIALVLLFTATIPLHAQTITNLAVAQRTDGSGMVDINFTLGGTGSAYYIAVEASFNGGSTFSPVSSGYLTGDTGPISPGAGKHII